METSGSNPHSPYAQKLHELVSIRNELMHLKDEVTVLEASCGEVSVHDGKATFALDSFRLPEFQWANVTLEQARRFREAVGIYFEEVLNVNTPSRFADGRVVCKSI